jgi:hypothetical protein
MAAAQEDLSTEFTRLFNRLAPHHHRHTVLADFAELAYCAIRQQTLPPGPESEATEERYMTIVAKHKPDDIREMPKLLAWTQMAVAEGGCDFLGSIAQKLELADARSGQFFTPYDVSRLLAEMTITDEPVPKRGFHTLMEPACGAGGMVIAAADVMVARGVDIETQLFAEAWDVSSLCYHMAYIQIAARGIPAFVRRANSLSMEIFESAATPAMSKFLAHNEAAFLDWRAEAQRAAPKAQADHPQTDLHSRQAPATTNAVQQDFFEDPEP